MATRTSAAPLVRASSSTLSDTIARPVSRSGDQRSAPSVASGADRLPSAYRETLKDAERSPRSILQRLAAPRPDERRRMEVFLGSLGFALSVLFVAFLTLGGVIASLSARLWDTEFLQELAKVAFVLAFSIGGPVGLYAVMQALG